MVILYIEKVEGDVKEETGCIYFIKIKPPSFHNLKSNHMQEVNSGLCCQNLAPLASNLCMSCALDTYSTSFHGTQYCPLGGYVSFIELVNRGNR